MKPPVNSSALHVLHTLRLVCAAEAPLSHAEISRRAGLPSTTVYRALSTLEEAQYVQRSQASFGYEPGIVPQLLLWTLLKRFPLSTASAPFLTRLAELSGGTASLCVRLGWYALRVCVVYGSSDIYHRDRLGEVALLHTRPSSLGIFAFLPDSDIDPYRRFVARHHDADAPAIDRPALRREVEAARNKGYVGADSSPADALSVAMPLRGGDGQVVGSVALSGSARDTDGDNPVAVSDAIFAVLADLENELRNDPSRAASPYAQLKPDDIVIRLPKPPARDI